MNLDQLIAAGAIAPHSSVRVKKTVTWKTRDDNGEPLEHVFDVHIKKEMSAADFEYLFRQKQDDDEVIMARQVHRLLTLGENGEEKISYEAAASMKVSLLFALSNAVNEVQKPTEPKEENKSIDGESEKN